MFYSLNQSKLKKNEHLEAIRIAAYFFKRLKKPHVQATDISSSIDEILKDELQMVTCRVSGYLLLGIVRIYSKKVEYMLCDCRDVLQEITNFAVRSRKDSPEEIQSQRAPYFSITLPESYELDAFDVEIIDDAVDGNVLPREQITLKESGLENLGIKEPGLDMCLFEDIAGSYYPCSVMYSPFNDILTSYGIDLNLRKLLHIDGMTTAMEIIKEDSMSSQRECIDQVVLTPVEEHFQDMDITQNEECQDRSENTIDPKISSSEYTNVEVHVETLQNFKGNDVSVVRSSEVEDLPSEEDHVEQPNEDLVIDQEHTMVSELDHQEKDIHNPDHGDASPSDLQAEIEKLRDNLCAREETVDHFLLRGPEGPRDLVDSFVEEHCKDGDDINLSEIPNEEEKCHNGSEEDESVSEMTSTANIKIPDAFGAVTPQFMCLPTPAPKEHSLKSRKRKCIVDEAIRLSSQAMKRNLHDASDLVSKRRKLAHTALDVWRAARSLPRCFFDPLLTGISPELKSLYYVKRYKMTMSSKTIAPLEKLDISKITSHEPSEPFCVVAPKPPVWSSSGTSEQVAVLTEIPVERSMGVSEQMEIAPETPVQRSTITRAFEQPLSPGTPNCESVRPSLFESPRREPSLSSLDQQFDLNLEDEVTSSQPEDNNDWNGWSARTRLVTRYLSKSFRKLEERATKETLNLSQIVKGKTQKESARFFYEILVLSSKGFVGVKQEDSYGDILVRKLQSLDL